MLWFITRKPNTVASQGSHNATPLTFVVKITILACHLWVPFGKTPVWHFTSTLVVMIH